MCPSGFSGSRCQILSTNTNHNSDNCFCRNNGICQADGSCRCQNNFYGVKCEFDFNLVTAAPPVNCPADLCVQGTCQLANNNSYFCVCRTGYTGIRCNEVINVCQTANPCRNGICTSQGNNQYTCACYTGFYGVNCELSNSATNSVCETVKPCVNGVCTPVGTTQYNCACYQGWSGFNCQTSR